MKYSIIIFSILYLAGCAASGKYTGMTGQHPKTAKSISMQYLLYVPEDYSPDKKIPLIMFLHGAGERGNDINKVKVHGLPKLVSEGKKFPFIIISPQCPLDQRWDVQKLKTIMDEVIDSFNIDHSRIYLTGLSMGGFGTWAYAIAYPDKFAAIAPVCGGGDTTLVCKIKHLPVWVFHGDKDDVVPIRNSKVLVDALKKCGGNVRFTVYPGVGHDSWTDTYNNPELYKWLLAHKRK